MKTFAWSRSVTIPADALQKADHLDRVLQLILWIGNDLPYLITIPLLAVALMARHWRIRKMKKHLAYDFDLGVLSPDCPW